MSCIETFHLRLRKPPVYESPRVVRAFWRAILFFPAFLLNATYSFLAILGQDTGLDGPVIWLGMSRFMFLSVTFKVVYAYVRVCIHTSPISYQGGQKPNNKESFRKSHIYTPSIYLTSSLSGRQNFKQLDWKNDFLILQDPSTLKIKLINMEHSLWKSLAFIQELSHVSSLQFQYNGLAVLKIQPNLNKHQVEKTQGGY